MNRFRRKGLLATTLALAGLGTALAFRSNSSAPPPKPADSPASPALGFAGVNSCSARACHGGLAPKDDLIRQNEYTVFTAYDKHAQAYAVLLDERAQTMARNLAPTNPDGKPIPAHQDTRCLACHSVPRLANPDAPPATVALRNEGVGCEACHGPALGPHPWLRIHTAPAEWREKYEKNPHDLDWKQYGFTDLSDLKIQAATCAGCHVGAPADPERGIPARDCNHDIMAAGHPRLNFELSVFRANLPPHWNVAGHKQNTADYEAKVWAAGQIASAEASLGLLARRAERAAKDYTRWPEFAEYSCFSCHVNFEHPSWRVEVRGYGERLPGSLPYDPWYTAMLPALAPNGAGQFLAIHKSLAAEMSKPLPDPAKVSDLAGKGHKALDQWLQALNLNDLNAAALRKEIKLAGAVNGLPRTWEEAMQLTLAASALSVGKPEFQEVLNKLAKALAYPGEAEGPASYPRPDAETLKQQFSALQELLSK